MEFKPSTTPALPVESVLDELETALAAGTGAVLQAPPGAGKTTRVPLALLQSPWLVGKKILMLEPRRLATRAAAFRMADTLGQRVGQTVGYRVRLDTRVGPTTRIEVITEGVLTRILQADPALVGVGLVIFDEFHERSLDADLGLALCLDLQGVLNLDLRLLVMSATLAAEPVAALLGDAPVITCRGRSFPVETRHIERLPENSIEKTAADTVLAAAAAQDGGILVFLPGGAEIRRTEHLLKKRTSGPEWRVVPLHGNLTRSEQDLAIAPAAPGKRKVVLATSIAETSLTIDGIRIVVDSGLMRVQRFDVGSGMARLETVAVSRASADQRRGRAGRTCPGICYRLWSREAHRTLAAAGRPEILEADLAPLALELAAWGIDDPGRLAWLDLPPPAAFSQARKLLADLGALDRDGRITTHGRQVAGLPVHPRLAHMLLAAESEGHGESACDLAALVSEREIVYFSAGQADADLGLRLDILRALRRGNPLPHGSVTVDRAAGRQVIRVADTLKQRLGISSKGSPSAPLGRLLAWAYPDRIARRRSQGLGRFLLANGRGAYFTTPQPLAAEDYLVAARLDGNRREARIFLAAATDKATLLEQYGRRVCEVESVVWDPARRAVIATKTLQLAALTLDSMPLKQPKPEMVREALVDGIRREGIDCLAWTRASRQWQARILFLRRAAPDPEDWPDLSDAALADSLESWLVPHLAGITRLRDLNRISLQEILTGLVNWPQQRQLDQLAPTHWTVPSGSRIPIDYSGDVPVLAVRLQEMFGATQTPVVAGGRVALLIHLLSPAGRPVQVTRDIAGFWESGYLEVKKELKGRYPKHYWPDDPLHATATNRAKPRKRRSPRPKPTA